VDVGANECFEIDYRPIPETETS